MDARLCLASVQPIVAAESDTRVVLVGCAMLAGPAAPDRFRPDDPLMPAMVADVRPGMVWFTLARYPGMVRVDGGAFRFGSHLAHLGRYPLPRHFGDGRAEMTPSTLMFPSSTITFARLRIAY